ncbi:MAG: tRNA 4-thiouridine(8) synthase ThiI [Candidatus Parcubacteria bacterium]|nr:tRNA 4-thiouridine(8) synthase ThiI [Candidatus Parcubacteria bacterium]
MAKGLCLFSGGLDSALAMRLLERQGVDVVGLTLVSYFFNAETPIKMARQLNIPLRVVDVSLEHLVMVKRPRYGYGKNMNPCLDCHLMMLRRAKQIMAEEGFDFVATGEVLGERPFSQNIVALNLLEKESGLTGYLLRPLSAKLLPPTIPEQKDLINRDKLLDVSGRSRQRQIALALEWGISEYPTPAGGCCLTDPGFSGRFKELLAHWPKASGDDIQLLKYGRIFWQDNILLIIGRDQEENNQLEQLKQKGDILVSPKNFSGPTILIRAKANISSDLEILISLGKKLIQEYSKKHIDLAQEFNIFSD